MIWVNLFIVGLAGVTTLFAREAAKEENWHDALGYSLVVLINLAVFIASPGGGQ